MGYVTQWGGMDVGSGMLFSANVVDGMVHQLGGWKLVMECNLLPVIRQELEERCPVGHAVMTGPGGSELQEHFDALVHTVPPFYDHHPNPEHYLLEAYRNSLAVAFDNTTATNRQKESLSSSSSLRAACPLLGAGGRGFSESIAIQVAGQASQRWLQGEDARSENPTEGQDDNQEHTLAFAIPDIEIAEQLLDAIKIAEP